MQATALGRGVRVRCSGGPSDHAEKAAATVERAADLGAALAFDLSLVAPRLPDFPMPGAFTTEMEYLRHLTFEGARRAYPGDGSAVAPEAP